MKAKFDNLNVGDLKVTGTITDQPPPVKNDLPAIQDLVLADIEERKRLGVERYGTLLQPFNGRNSLVDAYQEVLDLAIYLRQLIYEEEHRSP